MKPWKIGAYVVACLSAMVVGLAVSPAFAQAGPVQDGSEGGGQEATVPVPPSNSSADTTEYDKLMNEWGELEATLKLKQKQFETASRIDRPVLASEFRALLADANELLAKLKSATMAVFNEDPTNQKALETLTGFLVNDAASGNDVACFQLAEEMFAKEVDEQYFVAAGEAARLGPRGREVMEEIVVRYREMRSDQILPRVKMVVADSEGTEKGTVVLELFENQAPNTVANFIHLVEQGYYTEKANTFHRVMDGFMAQAGCPEGNGSGGPGWEIENEVNRPDFRRHFKGAISMALEPNAPDSGGSQFFITFTRRSDLDGTYAVFGRVIEGQDVVDSVTRRLPQDDEIKADIIKSIEVIQKRDHEYMPKKILEEEPGGEETPTEETGGEGEDGGQ